MLPCDTNESFLNDNAEHNRSFGFRYLEPVVVEYPPQPMAAGLESLPVASPLSLESENSGSSTFLIAELDLEPIGVDDWEPRQAGDWEPSQADWEAISDIVEDYQEAASDAPVVDLAIGASVGQLEEAAVETPSPPIATPIIPTRVFSNEYNGRPGMIDIVVSKQLEPANKKTKRTIPVGALNTDILMGQSPGFRDHPGNMWLRELVAERYEDYQACGKKRKLKTEIANQVVREVEAAGGRFRKCENSIWVTETDHKKTREKVSSDFRGQRKYRSR